jgi:N-acetylneuraminate synthase
MTSPYDLDYVDSVNKYIDAYKIGSGDIDWIKIIKKISKKNKHVMLATGASNLLEVKNALRAILKYNKKKVVLMQCNTNYTNSCENFNYINLKVLLSYKKLFKNKIILGLSDHTPGHITVLGAVALGAKVIEKHFTDDNSRNGPDHKFSMNFRTGKSMVKETRLLEKSLGDGNKRIEKNEIDSSKVQKRSCYAKKIIPKGKKITEDMIIPLRPVLKGSFKVSEINFLIDKKAKRKINQGECIKKKLVQ